MRVRGPSLVPGPPGAESGPGWRGVARPGGLTPGPGPATGQHANIVTVGRERERDGGSSFRVSPDVHGKRHPVSVWSVTGSQIRSCSKQDNQLVVSDMVTQ